MAKALYGHLMTGDSRLMWENDRLRARIWELEAKVEQLSLELTASVDLVGGLTLDESIGSDGLRPALA